MQLKSTRKAAVSGHVRESFRFVTSIRAHRPPTFHTAPYYTGARTTPDAADRKRLPVCRSTLTVSSFPST